MSCLDASCFAGRFDLRDGLEWHLQSLTVHFTRRLDWSHAIMKDRSKFKVQPISRV
jgi:hypothetical protein